MNQKELREKMNTIVLSGLSCKAISTKTKIAPDILSRFKNGHVCLCQDDAERLEAYLDKVNIP